MVHETVIHRADAALALQRPTEIASDLAADGITELLQIIPYVLEKPDTVGLLGVGQSLHLHAIDTGLDPTGEWTLSGTADGLLWEHAPRTSDVTVRGRAADLLLLLNRRIPADDPRVEILGARRAGVGQRQRVALGTPCPPSAGFRPGRPRPSEARGS